MITANKFSTICMQLAPLNVDDETLKTTTRAKLMLMRKRVVISLTAAFLPYRRFHGTLCIFQR